VPNIKLTNLAAYRAYFQAIATSHVDIDGYKWGDADVVRNDNRSDITSRFLWAMPYNNSRYGDKYSDNVHKTKQARVAYMIVPDSEKFSDEDTAFDFCEAVIEQIMAKLLLDKRGKDVAGTWEMILSDINSWTGGPVEKTIGSTKYIGWELQINFMDNTNLSYDDSKWA